MVNGIRASNPPKFRVGSWFRQETPEKGRMTYRPKCYEYNNKDEDNSAKALNNKNHQAWSQKFRLQIEMFTFSNIISCVGDKKSVIGTLNWLSLQSQISNLLSSMYGEYSKSLGSL